MARAGTGVAMRRRKYTHSLQRLCSMISVELVVDLNSKCKGRIHNNVRGGVGYTNFTCCAPRWKWKHCVTVCHAAWQTVLPSATPPTPTPNNPCCTLAGVGACLGGWKREVGPSSRGSKIAAKSTATTTSSKLAIIF